MTSYYADDEARIAQQFLRDYSLPEGVRVVARPGKKEGVACVQLTCHGPNEARSVRRDALGVWTEASEAEKASMIRGLIEGLATPS